MGKKNITGKQRHAKKEKMRANKIARENRKKELRKLRRIARHRMP